MSPDVDPRDELARTGRPGPRHERPGAARASRAARVTRARGVTDARGVPGVAAVLAVALVLAVTPAAAAQERDDESAWPEPIVDVREVSVRKNRPDEVFHEAGVAVTFWVHDEAGTFANLVPGETELRAFADSTGKDLIAGHHAQRRAWNEKVERLRNEGRFVSMGRSTRLLEADELDDDEGAAGFYLTVDSWDLPAPGAETISVTAEVTYVLGGEEEVRDQREDLVLGDTKIISAGEWGVRPTDFNRDDGMIRFTLSSALPLTRFNVYNEAGEQVGSIVYIMNGRPVVEMPESLFDAPIDLLMTYREPIKRSVTIDEQVDVGL